MPDATAKSPQKFKPVTDTVGAELFASALAIPLYTMWLSLFKLFTARSEDADEQISGLARAGEVLLTPKVIEPPDHAEILGIEGRDMPAFVETPVTRTEAVAAGPRKEAQTRSVEGEGAARKQRDPVAQGMRVRRRRQNGFDIEKGIPPKLRAIVAGSAT